jgi:hypothetical protein
MNMDGASGSQLRKRPSDLPSVKVMFPREMGYIWTLLQAHTKGLKVGSDGVKEVTREFTLRRVLGYLAARFLCNTALREHLDGPLLIYAFFDLSLFFHSFPFSIFWRRMGVRFERGCLWGHRAFIEFQSK